MNVIQIIKDRRIQLGAIITLLLLLMIGVSLSTPSLSQGSSSSNTQSTSNINGSSSSNSSSSSPVIPATVTMSFDSKGGTAVEPITITNNASNTAPTPPTKTFNTFLGWYYEETYLRIVNFQFDFIETPVSSNLTVYARWFTQTASIQFVYLNNNDQEVNVSTQNVPMLTCKDDFNDNQYGLTIPTVPTSPNINQYTYSAWDLSVLPDCLNEESHYSIKIFAPKVFKDFTRTLAQGFLVNRIKDIEYTSALSSIILSADNRVYSVGSNSVFKMPSLNGTVDNSAYGNFDVTHLIPLNENETVVDLVTMYAGSNPNYSIRPGILFLTSASRILDFNNVTQHGEDVRFKDITSKLNLANGETIMEMVSGSNFFVTLTSSNRIVGLGNLPSYPGTNFTAPTVVNTPSVLGDDIIVDISAGYRSVALRTNTGKAAVFGANQFGQIGLPETVSNTPISLLDEYTNVSLIEAIHDRIYIIGDKDAKIQKVYASGYYIYNTINDNAYTVGFVELTKFDQTNPYYELLANDETIIQIAGLSFDTLFLTSAGRILTVGPNVDNVTFGSSVTNAPNPLELNSTTLRDTTDFLGTVDATQTQLHTFKGASNANSMFFVKGPNNSIQASGKNFYTIFGSDVPSNATTFGLINPVYTGWRVIQQDQVAYNTRFTIPDPEPIEGLTFIGWSLSETGTIHLQPGGTASIDMPAYNLILYGRYISE